MKYANVRYTGQGGYINMGDVLLLMSIDDIYKKMGIKNEEIIYIDYKDLGTYTGEECVLPVVSALIGYHDGKHITCFSKKIHPVFISLNIISDTLKEDDIDYLIGHSPIGCRDNYTCGVMKKYGIPAYVNGCITFTKRFEERKQRKKEKVLLVDINDKIKRLLPEELLKNGESMSQMIEVRANEDIQDCVQKQYLYYFENARLVITSRLHCAIPMIVGKVPVIYIPESIYEYRISGLQKIIKPQKIEDKKDYLQTPTYDQTYIKHIQTEMEMLVSERIKAEYLRANYLSQKMWGEERKYSVFVVDYLKQQIDNLLKNRNFKIYSYGLWGCGQIADMMFRYMKEYYSKIDFVGMFDANIIGEYEGISIRDSNSVFIEHTMDLIIVLPMTIKNRNEIQEKCDALNIHTIFALGAKD